MKTHVLIPLLTSIAVTVLGCAGADKGTPAAMGGTAAGGTAAGGTATGGTTGLGTGGVCDAPNLVFNVMGEQGGCNGPICHIPANVSVYPPDLISPDVATRLINQPSLSTAMQATAACSGQKYIDTANIENSLMLKKIGPNFGCGQQMPFLLAALPQDKVDCIRSWVTSVAAGH